MRPFLIFILNIILFLYYTILFFILMLWYGKLPKVSPYHLFNIKGYSTFNINDIFNDENIQGRYYYPKDIEYKILLDKLNDLCRNDNKVSKYLKGDVPIYNEDNKKIGIQTLYSLICSEIEKSK